MLEPSGGPKSPKAELSGTLASSADFSPLKAARQEGAPGPNSVAHANPGSTESGAGGRSLLEVSEPRCKQDWLRGLASCRELIELGIKLAWGLNAGLAALKPSRARPTQTPAGHRGCLFPLPVIIPEALSWHVADIESCGTRQLAVKCWLAVACSAINALYDTPKTGIGRKPGKVHRALLLDLERKIVRFLGDKPLLKLNFSEVVEDLKAKKVSYSGEEVLQPHALSAKQILKGLPPPGHGGSVPLLPFLHGRTRFLLENPSETLLPEHERGHAPVNAKVHIKKGQELDIFNLLRTRGIIEWFEDSQVFSDSRGQYLSGLFGVVKPNKFTSDGEPVLRVIMNLIPVNGIFTVIQGDITSLPHATNWLPLCISDGEGINMSQADMSSAFYLFGIPKAWRPYMCFGFRVKGVSLGFGGDAAEKWWRPSCCVLPMGWSSSVGIMQAISREVLLSNGLPPECELRKGADIPPWFAQVCSSSTSQRAWWQVYLDNFMSAEVNLGETKGLDRDLQSRALAAWDSAGILIAEDKEVVSAKQITELGVRIEGSAGLLGGSPERLMKTILGTLHHLQNPVWSKKEAQVILGRWIFLLQFRRAAMGVLSNCWEVLEYRWPNPKQLAVLHGELLTLVCLGPLIQTDLTSTYDGEVTCSDASESGGAAAISSDLSWSGKSLVGMKSDLRLRPFTCFPL